MSHVYFLQRKTPFDGVSMLFSQGSKKKEMVDRLLKPALEMRETQEKYEFSLTLRFVLAFVNMDYDLCFFPLHRELDQLGYDILIEMAYEKSKVN